MISPARHWCAVLLFVVLAGCDQPTVDSEEQSDALPNRVSVLPGNSLVAALQNLPMDPVAPAIVSLLVSDVPEDSPLAGLVSDENPVALPIQAAERVVVQFRPDLGEQDVAHLIRDFDLRVDSAIPEIGVVVVHRAAAGGDDMTLHSADELGELGASSLAADISGDSRVMSATPDTLLSVLQIAGGPESMAKSLDAEESVDWGISDAKFDRVWARMDKEVRVGVIDLGFGPHTDLKLEKGVPSPDRESDHGTRVAGIMCAQHNGSGIKGALRNCTVVYATSNSLIRALGPVAGRDAIVISAFFSDFVATVVDFIRLNPDVRTINLSIGYNWRERFFLDPRKRDDIQNLVKGQAVVVMAILRLAGEKGIAIVSAAGNDSEVNDPIDARWASPFNLASELMKKVDGWTSALVVEAHDQRGRRASFSNTGGDISCPGIDVLSTVAQPVNGFSVKPGTSFASPYCAAGLAAVRTLLPRLSLEESLRCVKSSPSQSGSVPRLDLEHAIASCTENTVFSVDTSVRIIEQWAESMTGTGEIDEEFATSTCQYSHERLFTVADVFDQGDGQGPEWVDPSARQEVENYITSLLRDGCSAPLYVVLPWSWGEGWQGPGNFAWGVAGVAIDLGYPGEVVFVEWPSFRSDGIRDRLDSVLVVVGDNQLKRILRD